MNTRSLAKKAAAVMSAHMTERERLMDTTFLTQGAAWTKALRELLAAVEREEHQRVLATIAAGIRRQEIELMNIIVERRKARGQHED